eukprot:scaffold3664_cov407-Prasinococcus_capsulatus_cf.AAC.6
MPRIVVPPVLGWCTNTRGFAARQGTIPNSASTATNSAHERPRAVTSNILADCTQNEPCASTSQLLLVQGPETSLAASSLCRTRGNSSRALRRTGSFDGRYCIRRRDRCRSWWRTPRPRAAAGTHSAAPEPARHKRCACHGAPRSALSTRAAALAAVKARARRPRLPITPGGRLAPPEARKGLVKTLKRYNRHIFVHSTDPDRRARWPARSARVLRALPLVGASLPCTSP